MNEITERITIDPDVCNGKPTIRHKRITVQTILEFLSSGDSVESILEQYPTLDEEDVYACLKFAKDLVEHNYVVRPLAA
jgi:uncharacterized protein (DUF433 family)